MIRALSVLASCEVLAEAFGAGPPYYGRTTNLDKWSSPWPIVIGCAVASAIVVAITRARTPRGRS